MSCNNINSTNEFKPILFLGNLINKEKLGAEIYKFTIESEYVAKNAKAGQFVNVKCADGIGALLRRPISICSIDRENNTFDIVFQIKGNGTELLAKKNIGEEIDLIAPVGKGFVIDSKYKKPLIVGGGIGVFPLLGLLNEMPNNEARTILGFRNKDFVVLENEFKNASAELIITTDDGSYANKGFVTEFVQQALEIGDYDIVYACGPEMMLKAVAGIAKENEVPCQVSMEQRMGCGIGACLVCACKTRLGDEWEYSHVCVDGPVFWADEVIFE